MSNRINDAELILLRHCPVLISIARQFRFRMELAGKATFNQGDCAISDMITSIADALRADRTLCGKEQITAWYHACGVEAK